MLQIRYDMFFDKPGVMKHVRDGTRSALSKAGAFARRTMKGLIRPGKKSAKPGNPPKSHTGIFKQLIYFAYDAASQSVVIGPMFKTRQKPAVPELLDQGGTIASHWRTRKPATYHAFPYVQPTLKIEAPKFPELFSNAIK